MHKSRRLLAAVTLIFVAAFAFACTPENLGGEWVPAGMKKISTDEVEYNLYIPSSWEEDISTGVVTAYASSADRSSISMIAFDLDEPNQTVDEYWEKNKESFTSFFTEMEFETEGGEALLGGVPARKYVYTAKASGVSYKFMQVLCIKEGSVYIFTYTAISERYDWHIENVGKILENFSFKS